jgi:hypothetical protein
MEQVQHAIRTIAISIQQIQRVKAISTNGFGEVIPAKNANQQHMSSKPFYLQYYS